VRIVQDDGVEPELEAEQVELVPLAMQVRQVNVEKGRLDAQVRNNLRLSRNKHVHRNLLSSLILNLVQIISLCHLAFGDFYDVFRICAQLHVGITIGIWGSKGSGYGGLKSGGAFPQSLSAFLAAKLYCMQISFRGTKLYGTPLQSRRFW